MAGSIQFATEKVLAYLNAGDPVLGAVITIQTLGDLKSKRVILV
jgi:hypothetical protein